VGRRAIAADSLGREILANFDGAATDTIASPPVGIDQMALVEMTARTLSPVINAGYHVLVTEYIGFPRLHTFRGKLRLTVRPILNIAGFDIEGVAGFEKTHS
jgi:hypothetical protein